MKKIHIIIIVAGILVLIGLLGKMLGSRQESDCVTYYDKDGTQVLWQDCK
jgi:hypothetical protein